MDNKTQEYKITALFDNVPSRRKKERFAMLTPILCTKFIILQTISGLNFILSPSLFKKTTVKIYIFTTIENMIKKP